MQSMDFNFLSNTINTIGFYTTLLLFIFLILKPYLEKINNINLMKIQNEKMDIMMRLDPSAAEEEINKLVKSYVNEYILNNFIINNSDYIRKEEIELMVKNLTKSIVLELSELYIFYIKIQRDISDDMDILRYINKKVKEHVLEFVTEYNKER